MRGTTVGILILSSVVFAPYLVAQAPAMSQEFRVNAATSFDQSHPAVALSGSGDSIVGWDSDDFDGQGVFGRLHDSIGTPLSGDFQVNSYTPGDQRYCSVASESNGDFVVVWSTNLGDGDSEGVAGRRFDSSGNPLNIEFLVNTYTTGFQDFCDVAMDQVGNFVVVWHSQPQDGSSTGVFGQRFDVAGAPQGSEFQVNTFTTGGQGQPRVTMYGKGEFIIIWQSGPQDGDGFGVFGQRYDGAGNPLGGEFQVSIYTTGSQQFPDIASDSSGNFVVVWTTDGQDGSARGVFGRRYDSAGIPLSGEFQINSYTTGDQDRPQVAVAPGGNFLVTWESFGQDDAGDAASAGIYAQRFESSGRRIGSEFPLNTYTTGSQTRPAIAVDSIGRFTVTWESAGQDGFGAGIYARIGGFPEPQPMKVDERASSGPSDVNGVLETGETVTVDPSYTNNSTSTLMLSGIASNPTGPPGPTYTLNDTLADYGTMAAGVTNNCFDVTGDCFELTTSGTRPTAHWDATFDETLSAEVSKSWTLHVGESFPDVPRANIFYRFVENLFHNGVTGGCGAGNYCPGNGVSRAQMAVFLLKAFLGAFYAPPPATGTIFADVPLGSFAAAFIEDLYNRGITGGCGGGNYCPTSIVSRQQMAAFLLKTKYGSGFVPPTCTGIFPDVPCPSTFADWIEQLFAENITGGCGGGNYCPLNPNTRGQMAVFLVKTFGLLLYGP